MEMKVDTVQAEGTEESMAGVLIDRQKTDDDYE